MRERGWPVTHAWRADRRVSKGLQALGVSQSLFVEAQQAVHGDTVNARATCMRSTVGPEVSSVRFIAVFAHVVNFCTRHGKPVL